jgi:hypothetical protein
MFCFDTLRVSLSWPRAAVAGVLLFAGADVFQREFIPPPKSLLHLKTPNSHSVFRTTPGVFNGVASVSHVTINSRGIRGPEFPPRESACRVLCLGDSITECLYLDDSKTWPSLLMQRLNQQETLRRVWVGNAGHSAYGTFHHLHFLKESGFLKEIDCLVLLAGAADFTFAIHGIKEAVETDNRKKSKSWMGSFITRVWKKLKAKRAVDLATEDSKGDVYVARRKARMEGERCDVLPDLAEPLHRFRQQLRDICDLCRKNGVRLIMVSPATVCRRNLPTDTEKTVWGWKMSDGRYLSVAAVREGVDLYNQAIAETAKELNVEFVDLSALNDQTGFFLDGSHFNEEGARQVAGRVADAFLARHGDR